jgi:chromosome segregation ATPase
MVVGALDSQNSDDSSESLRLQLLKLAAKLRSLEKLWSEQKLNLLEAQRLLDELQIELENSQTSLASSQAEVTRLIDLSESLSARLRALQQSFDEYKEEARRELRRASLVGGLIGIVIGFVLGVLAP